MHKQRTRLFIWSHISETKKVWHGEWQGREVAIKVLKESMQMLDETSAQKFDDEMKLIRRLRHKNIGKESRPKKKPPKQKKNTRNFQLKCSLCSSVFFYGGGVIKESPFLVFEWLGRGSLEAILKVCG